MPAKSGVSGIVLVVVPNVVGFATWSPPLDSIGNSARGVMFAEELVKIYNFHTFDSVNSYILVFIIPYIPFPDWRAHQRQEEPESAKLRGTKSEACPTLVCCVPGIIFERSNLLLDSFQSSIQGDKMALERAYLAGVDMNMGDYDGRTALHLACVENHPACVKYLIETCKV